MLQQLSYLLDKVRTDNTVRVVIITGAGKSFSAGADIKFLNQATSYEIRELAQLSVNNKIETLGKVVVAAINGYALGGGLELQQRLALLALLIVMPYLDIQRFISGQLLVGVALQDFHD